MKKGRFHISQKSLYHYLPLLTILAFIGLASMSVFILMHKSKINTGNIIDHDLQVLVDVFRRIEMDCKVIGFDDTVNRINFLNVQSFSGSEVGPMNLAYPQQWKGPYLADNLTIQEKDYVVVTTNKGFFITPGPGVRLPNGNVVGLDVVLNKDADIEKMMQPGGSLYYNGKPLAVKLGVGASVFERVMRERVITLEDEQT